jgi:hypothetical protein
MNQTFPQNILAELPFVAEPSPGHIPKRDSIKSLRNDGDTSEGDDVSEGSSFDVLVSARSFLTLGNS